MKKMMMLMMTKKIMMIMILMIMMMTMPCWTGMGFPKASDGRWYDAAAVGESRAVMGRAG